MNELEALLQLLEKYKHTDPELTQRIKDRVTQVYRRADQFKRRVLGRQE